MLTYLALLESSVADLEYEAGRKYWNELAPHMPQKWDEVYRDQDEISWPPTPQEMREIEREILQKPEWLSRWAYFDWKSFQVASRWHYDRHRDLFFFSDVPQIGIHDGKITPQRSSLQIKSDGTILPSKSEYAHYYVFLPTAIEACMAVVRMAQPHLRLMRGTYFIRFGKWNAETEQSRNGLTKALEPGVSVYIVNYDLDEKRWAIDTGDVSEAAVNGTMQSLIYDKPYRPAYLVQGDEQEALGSDGEPLLKNVRLAKELHRHDFYVPGMFDPREDDWDEQ